MYKTDGIYQTWDEVNSTPHMANAQPVTSSMWILMETMRLLTMTVSVANMVMFHRLFTV